MHGREVTGVLTRKRYAIVGDAKVHKQQFIKSCNELGIKFVQNEALEVFCIFLYYNLII